MILQRRNSFITENDGVASVGRRRTGLSQGNSWERQLRRGLIPRSHTWRTLGTPHCSSNYNFPSSNPTEQHQNALTVHRVSKWPRPKAWGENIPGFINRQQSGHSVYLSTTRESCGHRQYDESQVPKEHMLQDAICIQGSLRQPEGAATWWVLSECIKLVV